MYLGKFPAHDSDPAGPGRDCDRPLQLFRSRPQYGGSTANFFFCINRLRRTGRERYISSAGPSKCLFLRVSADVRPSGVTSLPLKRCISAAAASQPFREGVACLPRTAIFLSFFKDLHECLYTPVVTCKTPPGTTDRSIWRRHRGGGRLGAMRQYAWAVQGLW